MVKKFRVLIAKTRFERTKEKWVNSHALLVEKCVHFKNKIRYGASAFADIATALEAGFTAKEEICYCAIDDVQKFYIETTKT